MLDRQEHAIEVDRGLTPPIRQRHLRNGRHRDPNAGIRDQDVEPAVALLDLGDDLDPARLAGDILMQEAGDTAVLIDGRGDLRTSEIVDIGDDDQCAFARKQLGDRSPDA
jgi:hypothetical protein